MPVPRPRPSILDNFTRHSRRNQAPYWVDEDGFYYTWDALHGEIEKFDRRGYHLGALDPTTGKLISGPVRGRRLQL